MAFAGSESGVCSPGWRWLRTVSRKAEQQVVGLAPQTTVNERPRRKHHEDLHTPRPQSCRAAKPETQSVARSAPVRCRRDHDDGRDLLAGHPWRSASFLPTDQADRHALAGGPNPARNRRSEHGSERGRKNKSQREPFRKSRSRVGRSAGPWPRIRSTRECN